jgi:integrase
MSTHYGQGRVFARGGTPDKKGKLKTGRWWIKYYRNGEEFAESCGSAIKADAEALLKRRIGEIAGDAFIKPADRRVTVEEIYKLLLNDYKASHPASYEGAEQRWQHPEHPETPGRLKEFFGHYRASQVTTDLLNQYINRCREAELSNATINRDLAALKRAFHLAYDCTPRKVSSLPKFPHLKESAPRQGFVEEPQYRQLVKHAPELWLRAMLAVAYTFGFRKSELLEMKVNQVDLAGETIRLWRGTTKSGEPRLVRMTQDVKVLLQACVIDKKPDHYVFSRNGGTPILDFRGRWDKLCEDAGLKGLLFHDLRRSAVRNMVRRGVNERVAMQISGHKTRSVFDRYNVVSETDLANAARMIELGEKGTKSGQFSGQTQQQTANS